MLHRSNARLFVRALFALRERLIPDIARTLAVCRERYAPALRPVFHDFPDDPASWEDHDDFLLGGDLLVAPGVEAGATHRRVRLPAGADWLDGWTGALHEGGATVEVEAPWDRPPYFRRREGRRNGRG